jgi:hypothetical protein
MSKCKSCGGEIDKGVKVCSACGSKQGMSILKKLLIGFGVLVLIGVIFNGGEKSSRSKASSSIALPQTQQQFIDVVQDFKSQYNKASNELQKSSIAKKRLDSLLNVLQKSKDKTNIQGWVGRIKTLSTTGEGNAHIAIKLEGSRDIVLSTWNNELSDIPFGSLVKSGTAVYEKIAQLAEGDTVQFSGSFFFYNGEINEQSMTEDGSMTAPEYTLGLDDISKF